MKSISKVGISVIVGGLVAATGAPAAQSLLGCVASGSLARIPGVAEASGLALSRTTNARLWTHNDSGAPTLVALDTAGTVTARVRLTGIRPEDWEAVATGPCPAGSCLFIGDIGDNDRERAQITVYRLPEPDGAKARVSDAFHASYPDGPHNAETLLVAADGRIHVVTKDEAGPPRLYRFPATLKNGATHALEQVALSGAVPAAIARITDGTVSPDGLRVVLRNEELAAFFTADDFFAGRWTPASIVDITGAGERQGEGVAVADDGTLYLTGEGERESAPGTFARLTCSAGLPAGDRAGTR